MDHFHYKFGRLFAEEVEVRQIVEAVGTPCYIYSKATFLDHLAKVQQAYSPIGTLVCFSVKACANIHILRLLAEAGSGFDVVSGGELFRVLKAGADPKKVVYAGVGKTDAEIRQALNAGIAYFNVESEQELQVVIDIAEQDRRSAKVALRVNPDVEYQTHAYTATGQKQTKFGIDIDRILAIFQQYGRHPRVRLCGLHVHLGSGGKLTSPYVEAVQKVLPLIEVLRKQGLMIEVLDLGGGYGAEYESGSVPLPEDYAAAILPLLEGQGLRLILEPGKSICANAGILVTRVLYTKQSGSKRFVIVDAGMNDLIRPALYDAFHFIWPVEVPEELVPVRRSRRLLFEGLETVDVVGPICESADFLAKDRPLPRVQRSDLLAVFTAGAYGFTMSSNYNARPRGPEVLVDKDGFRIIRRRETYQDLIAPEQ
ncbi:MAG: diaminopimelate decarboxylase [Sedimentisphaerales bacterium]|nr:diaminopimelate decarboxylase [Sedimentisphaerales bacterium]